MNVQYGNIWLTGANFSEQAGNISFPGSQETDVAPFLRASQVKVWGRGNKGMMVSFEVALSHVSYLYAAQFAAEELGRLPEEGELRFTRSDGSDALVINWSEAAIASVEPGDGGETTVIRYTFATNLPTTDLTPLGPGEVLNLLLTEDGEFITTEDGEPLEWE